VFINVRLPRVVAAAVIGAALSTAGASYQGMFRNPMVSPDILGASTGAGFGAALAILLGLNYMGITISSFCFGLGAVFLTYAISSASRLNATLSMVLSGIMVGSLFSAGTSFIKLIADTQEQLPQ
jgi:iron complex transport system permease protein